MPTRSSNATDPSALHIGGREPQSLIEKITREKIRDSTYWKDDCYGLNAATIVERTAELRYVGGLFGGDRRPTEFLCLLLKLLQIQPSPQIVRTYLIQQNDKYLRILGATYVRLTAEATSVYNLLEPLLQDYRCVRYKQHDGKITKRYIDVIIDQLLHESVVFDMTLPYLQKRRVLVLNKRLEPRISPLQEEFHDQMEKT